MFVNSKINRSHEKSFKHKQSNRRSCRGGALATGISVPFIAGEQASKDALRPVLVGEGLKPFEAGTDKDLILTSLAQGLSDDLEFTTIPEGFFYLGSPTITVNTSQEKGISINDPAVEQLRTVCLQALDKSGGYKSKVKKWCVEKTVRQFLESKGLKPFSSHVSLSTVKNTAGHKLEIPKTNVIIPANSFHDNSNSITIEIPAGEFNTAESKFQNLKNACVTSLGLQTLGDRQKYLPAIKTWCVELTVKDVLIRNGFEPLENSEPDSTWKEIIAGGWFENGKGSFFTKQILRSNPTLFGISGSFTSPSGGIEKGKTSEVTEAQISALKKECSKYLKKSFERNKFFTFTGSSGEAWADPVQEASWLCVKPRTVEDFVEKNLGKTFDSSQDNKCAEKRNWKTFEAVDSSYIVSDFWDYVKHSVTKVVGDTKTCIKESK